MFARALLEEIQKNDVYLLVKSFHQHLYPLKSWPLHQNHPEITVFIFTFKEGLFNIF